MKCSIEWLVTLKACSIDQFAYPICLFDGLELKPGIVLHSDCFPLLSNQITLLIQFPVTNCSSEKENPLALSEWNMLFFSIWSLVEISFSLSFVPGKPLISIQIKGHKSLGSRLDVLWCSQWEVDRCRSFVGRWVGIYIFWSGYAPISFFQRFFIIACFIFWLYHFFRRFFLRQSFSGEKPPQCTTCHWATTNKRKTKSSNLKSYRGT